LIAVRTTSEAIAPGSSDAATIRSFSESDQCRTLNPLGASAQYLGQGNTIILRNGRLGVGVSPADFAMPGQAE
jgi:hypothetical protein